MKMTGYKAFNPDLSCRGFHYKVGGVYTMPEKPKICESGFHFCHRLDFVWLWYMHSCRTRVCRVESLGDLDWDKEVDDDPCKVTKACTNGIRIISEIPFTDLLGMEDKSGVNALRLTRKWLFGYYENPDTPNKSDWNRFVDAVLDNTDRTFGVTVRDGVFTSKTLELPGHAFRGCQDFEMVEMRNRFVKWEMLEDKEARPV